MEQTNPGQPGPKPQSEVMCFACGTALYTHEIGAQIVGMTIDYENRVTLPNTQYYLCDECKRKAEEFLAGGLQKAIERREKLAARIKTLDLTGIDPGPEDTDIIIGS